MRSLRTQVRLRRLLRVYTDSSERLAESPADSSLGAASRNRLVELASSLQAAWAADAATVSLPALRRHVTRTLAAVDQAVAGFGRPGTDPRRLAGELHESALPLLLMLRGMEDVADRQLLDWLGAGALAKTA
ncbi:MAG TPA: hypothetical protein VNG93_10735 [Candidatus Dormibacteraeota bacterium]|nr:hypothetical protein [Candidatus Dormibacteraeota bacterium]